MKQLLTFVLLIFLAPALSPSAKSVQAEAIPLPLAGETIPCPIGLPAGEVEGETVVCGQIEVPENWDDPGDATVLIS